MRFKTSDIKEYTHEQFWEREIFRLFTLDEGEYPDYVDDIVGCINEEMEESFPEVTDYEIFDVDNTGEFRKAKVRIKAVKI